MGRSRELRKPSFLWQALLILLPVAILATVGFLSLRQDKIIAQHDAVERAQTIADNLLPRLCSALTNVNPEAFEHQAFQVDIAGNLLFPPLVSASPAPQPLNPSELSGKQLALWEQAQQAEVSDANTSAGTEFIRAFLAEKPPDRFASVANYNLGVLLVKQNQWQAASETFLSLLNTNPHAVAESGLSLERLAEFKLLQLSAIMTNPSTRATPPWFLCRTDAEVCHSLFSVSDIDAELPEYFGITVELAGKQLREAAPDLRIWRRLGFFEGGRQKGHKQYAPTTATNILASAVLPDEGIPHLKVNIYLTSPSTLFKRQTDRTFWFGSLVSVASLAAFVGLLSAWRAFNRQQELTEMKTNFVSSVSHELRAPIASVRLMAESLERGKISDPPRQQEYFRFIGQECRRLSSLIENVLDFSRIEQGRKQYEFEPTDLLALVQQTTKLMEPYASERQITLSLSSSKYQLLTSDYQLSLDGRAIQQALINLLDNAIKHSPNGQSVSVILEFLPSAYNSTPTRHNAEHAPVIQISVQDNGPGIPPEEHEKIFERFYRLGSELRRETQGVGIGLSIVKHIVEAHSGHVLVQSEPGKGSRFTIKLPMSTNKLSSHRI